MEVINLCIMTLCKRKEWLKMLQKYVDNYVDKVENSVIASSYSVGNITKMLHLI